ncbi:WD40 repeat domain-containing serine/threonine-protein kinase [Schlesneria paludicola]|uniref:WD40 repeat domain-containing serine/threonine-protein kinase n=1 Tax=Schlesneria paludicola TaxID=360056 RepID=UPI00029A77D2|nr:protein kinase [Schlesneria paludicola]
MDIHPNTLSGDRDARLTEMLLAWDEARIANSSLTPADFCRDCPELLPTFEKCLADLSEFDRQFLARAEVAFADHDGMMVAAQFPVVPGYELIEEIGRGGMGVVYKSRQNSLGRLVAIKTLPGSRWGMSGYADRLRQEAAGLSRVNHPNVVKIIDVVETPEAAAIVLEYVEGESLADRMKRGSISPDDAASIAFELATTMIAVHACGLLHRDIKPANILLDLRGAIKLADFGLVKEAGRVSGLTETGACFGTAFYMAPEQASGRPTDVRTDVYAIGATLYEMLSGRPPFVGVSTLDILEQVQHRDPLALRVLNPKIPRDLETICLRCLEKEPDRRLANAAKLADELDRFRRRLPILSRPIGPFERVRRWCRRRPAVASLIGLTFLSAAAIVTLLVTNNRNLTEYNLDLTHLNQHLKKLIDELDKSASAAKVLQHRAEAHERQTQDALYAADINRAALAWQHDNTRGMITLLDRHLPANGRIDQRGFEWWLLYRRAHRSHVKLLDIGTAQYLLAYTPDQRLMVAAGFDAVVRIFDPSTGIIWKQIATDQLEVNGVAFSPNGKDLATAGDDGTIRIWDLENATERLRLVSHHRKAFQLVYTTDGSQIISCGDDPIIYRLDARTGAEVSTLTGHQRDVQTLVLTDEGQTLVSAGNDRTVRFWNLKTNEQTRLMTSPGEIDTAIPVPDQNLLIMGNSLGFIQTIDLRNAQVISSTKHLDKIGALALHPNRSLLAAGDASGQIRLRRLSATGELSEEGFEPWHAHNKLIYALAWSPDGSKLISAGRDGRVISWSLAAIESAEKSEFELECRRRICLIPHSTSLLVRTPENHLMRWDWMSQSKISESTSEKLYHVATSADGKLFAAVNMHPLDGRTEGITVYQLPANRQHPLDQSPIAYWTCQGDLSNPRISMDGKSVAVSRWYQEVPGQDADHMVWILRLPDSGKRQTPDSDNVPEIRSAERIPVPFAKDSEFSRDGTRLGLITRMGLVMWDLKEKRILWEASNNTTSSVAFSPDGALVAVAGHDRMLQLLNATDGSVRFQSTDHQGPISCLTFSPDSRVLVSGTNDGTLKFWHVTSGQELFEMAYPGFDVQRLGFTDDGKFLISQLMPADSNEPVKILTLDGSAMIPTSADQDVAPGDREFD